MNFKEVLSEAIDNDTKIIITGKSGWGKSEMIAQVAEEKGLELIDFRLSEILPEDLIGIPKVSGDYYDYVPPKWLYEVSTHPKKKYLLFLDEITQGTPEVLNICYKIFDKVTRVGNYTLPNVSVVGATNYQDESAYLSELPKPLKNRACMLELDHNPDGPTSYLCNKYDIKNTDFVEEIRSAIIDSNPRAVEKAITLLQNKASKLLVTPYVGLKHCSNITLYLDAARGITTDVGIAMARQALSRGYISYDQKSWRMYSARDLKDVYKLSDEEYDLIQEEYDSLPETKEIETLPLKDGLISYWAAKEAVTGSELLSISSNPTFNTNIYISNMPLTVDYIEEIKETLESILGVDFKGLLRQITEFRTIPLQTMKQYREDIPWDIMRELKKKGWVSSSKLKEFAKELA